MVLYSKGFFFIFRDKFIKNIKARDTYGLIVDRVKNMKMMKAQSETDNADPPPPGGK